MMRRLTSRSFAGTSRTDVAVGTASERSMFSTMRAPVPRSLRGSGPSGSIAATAGGRPRPVAAAPAPLAAFPFAPFAPFPDVRKCACQSADTDDGSARKRSSISSINHALTAGRRGPDAGSVGGMRQLVVVGGRDRRSGVRTGAGSGARRTSQAAAYSGPRRAVRPFRPSPADS